MTDEEKPKMIECYNFVSSSIEETQIILNKLNATKSSKSKFDISKTPNIAGYYEITGKVTQEDWELIGLLENFIRIERD